MEDTYELQENIHKLYQEAQDKAGFQVGDIVKIVKVAESNTLGWHNSWIPYEMNGLVGKIATIESIGTNGVGIRLEGNNYRYPFFVLEHVKQYYSIGHHFMISGGEYILALTGKNMICMINTANGNRWSNAIEIEDMCSITYCEIKQLVGKESFSIKKEE